jgi:hypothetical protein
MPNQMPPLTFGIELEYVLAFKDDHTDAEQQEANGLWKVYTALQSDLRGRCRDCNGKVNFRLPLHAQWQHAERKKDYAKWNVVPERQTCMDDLDALGAHVSEYALVGIEVISRVMSQENPLVVADPRANHDHSIPYEQEVAAVLECLRERFQVFDSGQRGRRNDYLYANAESGLHVHVGAEAYGFDLETIKNLICFNIACERLLDLMHAPKRINGVDCLMSPVERATDPVIFHRLNNTENFPLSEGLQYRWFAQQRKKTNPLSLEIPVKSSTSVDIDSWMRLVREQQSLDEIRANVMPYTPRSACVNLQNLSRSEVDPTVEFRQHESTMQTDRVVNYIDFVVQSKLVE